jgi:hypothetical protein
MNEKGMQWEERIGEAAPNAVYRVTPGTDSTGMDTLLD